MTYSLPRPGQQVPVISLRAGKQIRRQQRFPEAYWDRVLEQTQRGPLLDAWRAYMRRVYARLLREWLPPAGSGRGLKTDLFEEALSPHHLLADLGPGSVGLDGSPAVVRAARERLAAKGDHYLLVTGDLRQLPLRSASVARILSGSSLDHFADKADIAASLAELARLLVPGGTLVITFDNPHNPVLWLRSRLPFAWLHRLRLVPYYVGATYARREAREQLERAGLRVTHLTGVAHAPRAPAIWLIALAEHLGWPTLAARLGRCLDRFEFLERWPTRYLTGYYLALRAEKPAAGVV